MEKKEWKITNEVPFKVGRRMKASKGDGEGLTKRVGGKAGERASQNRVFLKRG